MIDTPIGSIPWTVAALAWLVVIVWISWTSTSGDATRRPRNSHHKSKR